MQTFCFVIVTLLVAAIGALIGTRLRLPAGAMVGAMFAVLIMNLAFNIAYIPETLRVVTRIVAGSLIGSRIKKKDVIGLKDIIGASVILVFGLIVLGVLLGICIFFLSDLDLATALFASAPGGMSDMALVAEEMGADAPKVALLQLLRIITVFSIFPIILRYLCKHHKNQSDLQNEETEQIEVIEQVKLENIEKSQDELVIQKKELLKKTIVTLGIGTIGGILGVIINIPAGAMIGSMLFVAIYNIITQKAFIPPRIRIVSQATIGALIGSGMTLADVLGLKDIALPGLILVLGIILLNVTIGYFIFRVTDLDLPTALFASVPGGVTEMVLVAADYDADVPKVALLQLLRLTSVIIIFPTLLKFLCAVLT